MSQPSLSDLPSIQPLVRQEDRHQPIPFQMEVEQTSVWAESDSKADEPKPNKTALEDLLDRMSC